MDMSIEEIILSTISGAYIKTDSKGKFVIVIKKQEFRVGSHLVIPLHEVKILKTDEKNHYVFNKKFFLENGDIDDFELRLFISDWKNLYDAKRRQAKFTDERTINNQTMVSLNMLGKLKNDFTKWNKHRLSYLKNVESILNDI